MAPRHHRPYLGRLKRASSAVKFQGYTPMAAGLLPSCTAIGSANDFVHGHAVGCTSLPAVP